ncbi:calcium-binding protein [Heterostelium album PN500]|uniref:Calcium-binding protein n=1 Tax=Heterostelium pallidum (strain ATCC 26659 / Pp 5 / PN500) TaxID=670386 RepID=D3B2L9_HETP5|nr:calcium-binding protein [Heterostelium album PN500]EFA83567.1 calcium-binding protein [Heterostelium album PN500]|eukprot:XP_020435684.1 calcium-binding protein [Heterostelium album PN500]
MGQANTKLSKEELDQLMKTTKYSKDDIEILTRDFKEYSGADKKIGFSEEEFLKFFKTRFQDWSTEDMKKMFKVFDTDKNGTVDFKEFTTALYLMTKAPVEERMAVLFDIFDDDKSGTLSSQEVEKMIHVAVNCGTALGCGGVESFEYCFDLFKQGLTVNGLTKAQFVKIGGGSTRFTRMICFYDSANGLLY